MGAPYEAIGVKAVGLGFRVSGAGCRIQGFLRPAVRESCDPQLTPCARQCRADVEHASGQAPTPGEEAESCSGRIGG
jgi:hypothetical protein